eukprot:jgi/Bigna1/85378/estExt_fgenesh1_pg.C_30396
MHKPTSSKRIARQVVVGNLHGVGSSTDATDFLNKSFGHGNFREVEEEEAGVGARFLEFRTRSDALHAVALSGAIDLDSAPVTIEPRAGSRTERIAPNRNPIVASKLLIDPEYKTPGLTSLLFRSIAQSMITVFRHSKKTAILGYSVGAIPGLWADDFGSYFDSVESCEGDEARSRIQKENLSILSSGSSRRNNEQRVQASSALGGEGKMTAKLSKFGIIVVEPGENGPFKCFIEPKTLIRMILGGEEGRSSTVIVILPRSADLQPLVNECAFSNARCSKKIHLILCRLPEHQIVYLIINHESNRELTQNINHDDGGTLVCYFAQQLPFRRRHGARVFYLSQQKGGGACSWIESPRCGEVNELSRIVEMRNASVRVSLPEHQLFGWEGTVNGEMNAAGQHLVDFDGEGGARVAWVKPEDMLMLKGSAVYFQGRDKGWKFDLSPTGHAGLGELVRRTSPLLEYCGKQIDQRNDGRKLRSEGSSIYARKPNKRTNNVTWSQEEYAHLGFQYAYLGLKSVQRFTETWSLIERMHNRCFVRGGGRGGEQKGRVSLLERVLLQNGTNAGGGGEGGGGGGGGEQPFVVVSLGGGPGFELLALEKFLQTNFEDSIGTVEYVSLDLESRWAPYVRQLGYKFRQWDISKGSFIEDAKLAVMGDEHLKKEIELTGGGTSGGPGNDDDNNKTFLKSSSLTNVEVDIVIISYVFYHYMRSAASYDMLASYLKSPVSSKNGRGKAVLISSRFEYLGDEVRALESRGLKVVKLIDQGMGTDDRQLVVVAKGGPLDSIDKKRRNNHKEGGEIGGSSNRRGEERSHKVSRRCESDGGRRWSSFTSNTKSGDLRSAGNSRINNSSRSSNHRPSRDSNEWNRRWRGKEDIAKDDESSFRKQRERGFHSSSRSSNKGDAADSSGKYHRRHVNHHNNENDSERLHRQKLERYKETFRRVHEEALDELSALRRRSSAAAIDCRATRPLHYVLELYDKFRREAREPDIKKAVWLCGRRGDKLIRMLSEWIKDLKNTDNKPMEAVASSVRDRLCQMKAISSKVW